MTAGPYLAPFKQSYQDGFAIRAALLRPESRGFVRLKSADPRDPPAIVQNFLSTRRDWEVLRAGLRMAEEVGAQAPLRPFAGKRLAPLIVSDADLNKHVAETGITVHHPLGTCKMGVASDPTAVVDTKLNVFGTEALRVVDASVMPDLVGGNINAPVIMIAEKASDIIRGRVVGPDNQPVANVSVTATSLANQTTRSAKTGKDGRFTIVFNGGGGDYLMQYAAIGFNPYQHEVKREIGRRLNAQTLFGSDYPFISLDRWFEEFEALGLTAEAKEAILVGNASRLLKQ